MHPIQTPIRNQIAAAVYSFFVILKWIGTFLRDCSNWIR